MCTGCSWQYHCPQCNTTIYKDNHVSWYTCNQARSNRGRGICRTGIEYTYSDKLAAELCVMCEVEAEIDGLDAETCKEAFWGTWPGGSDVVTSVGVDVDTDEESSGGSALWDEEEEEEEETVEDESEDEEMEDEEEYVDCEEGKEEDLVDSGEKQSENENITIDDGDADSSDDEEEGGSSLKGEESERSEDNSADTKERIVMAGTGTRAVDW
ncbi:hypothetical protein M426DRAFT_21057 [Hypoxylon sp. CI-4A]|nr:hypothetical protein M426DRAFT_21057 [Hypoxylon sp. CI-4A]